MIDLVAVQKQSLKSIILYNKHGVHIMSVLYDFLTLAFLSSQNLGYIA